MTPKKMKQLVLTRPDWLEKAVISLDNSNAWTEEDAPNGTYYANWIRRQEENNVPEGERLTNDKWRGKARNLVQNYIPQLMHLAIQQSIAKIENLEVEIEEEKERLKKLEQGLLMLEEEEEPTPTKKVTQPAKEENNTKFSNVPGHSKTKPTSRGVR